MKAVFPCTCKKAFVPTARALHRSTALETAQPSMTVKTGIRGEGSQRVETNSILREPNLKEVIQVASKGASSADDGVHDAQSCPNL